MKQLTLSWGDLVGKIPANFFSSSHQILFPACEKGSCTYIHEHMDVEGRGGDSYNQ